MSYKLIGDKKIWEIPKGQKEEAKKLRGREQTLWVLWCGLHVFLVLRGLAFKTLTGPGDKTYGSP